MEKLSIIMISSAIPCNESKQRVMLCASLWVIITALRGGIFYKFLLFFDKVSRIFHAFIRTCLFLKKYHLNFLFGDRTVIFICFFGLNIFNALSLCVLFSLVYFVFCIYINSFIFRYLIYFILNNFIIF